MLDNPEGLSHLCELTKCDLPWVPLPVFVSFYDHSKGVGGLVSKRFAKLGTLKVISLVREGRKWAIAEVTCDWRLLSLVRFYLSWISVISCLHSCLVVEFIVSWPSCGISFGFGLVIVAGSVVLLSEGT